LNSGLGVQNDAELFQPGIKNDLAASCGRGALQSLTMQSLPEKLIDLKVNHHG